MFDSSHTPVCNRRMPTQTTLLYPAMCGMSQYKDTTRKFETLVANKIAVSMMAFEIEIRKSLFESTLARPSLALRPLVEMKLRQNGSLM